MSYSCTGTTRTGAPCRNVVAAAGGNCGRCLGPVVADRLAGGTDQVRQVADADLAVTELEDRTGSSCADGKPPVGSRIDWSGSDLRDAEWGESDVSYLNRYDGSNMEGGYIDGIHQHSTFRGLQARRSEIGGIHWSSDFTEADLSHASFRHGVDQGNFTDANLTGVTSNRTSFKDCTFDGADMRGASLDGDFSGCDFSKAKNFDPSSFGSATYSPETKFPPGVEPTRNWKPAAPPPANNPHAGMTAAMRASAREGTFSPWKSYRAA